ncbi:hypothetical protein [Neorhizobium sp. JUb45]|uniref:lipopolysaccharide biosynthesis protein n=1 Tax=unclassified Neorhizobium TaxID=2629175 RepID=UPI00104F32E0|nr:hypothetical protein [Neorhizobium sp. JUb45]TCQ98227.1 O-antigen/teichoic acid export membrane protein [Neorhizobium sp. JUb45]
MMIVSNSLFSRGRRLVLMVGGEAIQSGFHFALNIYMLHVLAPYDYGVFAISMVMGGAGIAFIRSLCGMPASIWIGRTMSPRKAHAYDVTFGSVAFFLAMGMAVPVAGLLYAWQIDSMIAGGLFVGLWSLRNYLRTSYFAQRRSVIVSWSDTCFTAVGIAATAIAAWQGGDILGNVFDALAFANGLAIVVLLALARRPVRITLRPAVRRRYVGLWPQLKWSAFSVTTILAQGQCTALMVTAVAGPAAFAPIAAVLSLFAPLRIIATAFDNMMQPELSALVAQREIGRVWGQARFWSLVMGAGAIVYGVAVFALAPHLKAQSLAGLEIGSTGVPALIIFAMIMVYSIPRLVLEVLNDFWTLAMINFSAALVGLAAILAILVVASPSIALAGAAVSESIVCLACWLAMKRKLDLADRSGRQDTSGEQEQGKRHAY